MLKYKELKQVMQHFREKEDSYVTLPKDFAIEILSEIIKVRRRDIAQSRQSHQRNCDYRKDLVKDNI